VTAPPSGWTQSKTTSAACFHHPPSKGTSCLLRPSDWTRAFPSPASNSAKWSSGRKITPWRRAGWKKSVTPIRTISKRVFYWACAGTTPAISRAPRRASRSWPRRGPLPDVARPPLARPALPNLDAEGDSADPDYQFNIGYVLWKRGEFVRAAESFRALLDRSPEDTEAVLFLGRCIKNEGPRQGDPRGEGRERLKLNFEETAYRQLKAELESKH